MKRYTPDEIKEFLVAIDRNLSRKAKLIIIGGTAAALGYQFSNATQDIDTANSVRDLESVIKKAKTDTGYDIPVGTVGVYDAPHDFEDRLRRYEAASFRKLEVLYPEAIDLILMKAMRCEEHDLQAIEQIVKIEGVEPAAILRRYLEEMSESVKNERDRDFNVAAVVDRCFGGAAAAKAVKEIEHARRDRR